MKTLLIAEVNKVKERLGAYFSLMTYKYSNLCTKAEPASLLAVDVYIDATRKDIEEVAIGGCPREDQISIVPKNEHYLEPIIRGIYDAHPEFKLEIKYLSEELKREDERYLLYTMPEVDKNRRDLLVNAVKSLHDETAARIEVVFNKDKLELIQGVQGLPLEEVKELEDALDEAYNQYKDMVNQAYDKKKKEIEDAYEKYLRKHPEEGWEPETIEEPGSAEKADGAVNTKTNPEAAKESQDFDVSKGIKMDMMDED